MFQFKGTTKHGQDVTRYAYAIHLSQALGELYKCYDAAGGATPEALALLGQRIDRMGAGIKAPREVLQSELHTLLRARDIHRFVVENPSQTPLKLHLMEHLLFFRTDHERWAAVKGLLLENLESLCGVPAGVGQASLEAMKRQLSDGSSPVGQLLVATALFLFDQDPELPPANLRIHFLRKNFPEHGWLVAGPMGGDKGLSLLKAWRPTNPLCRWEYLAADLLQSWWHLSRQQEDTRRRDTYGATTAGEAHPSTEHAGGLVYCRLTSEENPTAQQMKGQQMDLLPLEGPNFATQVVRLVHRKLDSEGVQLLALLLGRLAQGGPGQVVRFNSAELLSPLDLETTSRSFRDKVTRLERVVELLAGIEISRLCTEGDQCALQTAQFMTVLGRSHNIRSPQAKKGGGSAPLKPLRVADAAQQRMDVLADPVFYLAGEGLISRFRQVPLAVLTADPKLHPYVLGLYVLMRSRWDSQWEQAGGRFALSAGGLLEASGMYVSPTGRYRAIETLKRELAYLAEQKLLARWHMKRSLTRDALDDVFTLEAPEKAAPVKTTFPRQRIVPGAS